jgi:hypothetical protein
MKKANRKNAAAKDSDKEKNRYRQAENSTSHKNDINPSRQGIGALSTGITTANETGKNINESSAQDKLNNEPVEKTGSDAAEQTISAPATENITAPADATAVKEAQANTSVVAETISSPENDTAKTDSTFAGSSGNKTEAEKTASKQKFQIGFFISWDYNQYHLKENAGAENPEADYIMNSDSMNGNKSAAQFTVGLRGSYFISEKLAIEAGAYYSQKRKVDAVIYTPQYSSSVGTYVSDFIYHFDAKYFEVDERIKYFVYPKKPSVYVAAGAKQSFSLNQNHPDYFEHTRYSESAAPRTERVLLKPASVGVSLMLAAGAEIPLNARCNFFIEPAYTYSLDPVINNPDYVTVPVNLFRRSFSLGTGLNYKF